MKIAVSSSTVQSSEFKVQSSKFNGKKMIRKIKQISLFMACMILLLHAAVPHHHHNNTVCLSKLSHKNCDEHCSESHDNSAHHNDNDCEESDCIIDDLFTAKDNHEVKIYLDVNVLFSDYNIISLAKITLENILKNKGIDFRRGFIPLIYHNPHVSSIFGLRAPPV